MTTPCSPKKPKIGLSTVNLPRFGVKSTGLKVPGATHPLWPPRGMVHVRGDSGDGRAYPVVTLPASARKSKGQVVTVPSHESVVQLLAQQIDVTGIANLPLLNDHLAEEAGCSVRLRLPQKHFESGCKLQQRIRPQLRTFGANTSAGTLESEEDELSATGTQPTRPHPAIERLYNALEHQLSAYDKSDCENAAWVHKYAPLRADEVLQGGKDAILLREWLARLKVQAVNTGASDSSHGKQGSTGLPAKKKRKPNKLDGFVVSSDEEADELAEVSEAEEDWPPSGSQALGKKTVIRSGDLAGKGSKEAARLTNAVLISGPHGCGKTAAVFAMANELNFEIFEINPGSRRQGKDILDKVGDMTRNHLVQRHRAGSNPIDGDVPTTDDEVSRDLKSGRQSTMGSFFKPKTGTKLKKVPKAEPPKPSSAEAKVSQPKSQKQSLILLEEVDILYEEDKQFWTTVISLIMQSKRPFVMTCNDEHLVPIQSLPLHGIFRFNPPPSEVAVDALILMAANEGHALQRRPVEALYESRSGDFRASLMELNYWCQIGVGDRRGGFDWFFPRWPKGCDADEEGHVVRVVSEGTYQRGMGWFGGETLTDVTTASGESEVMAQSWDAWQMDPGSWAESRAMASWAKSLDSFAGTPQARLATLEQFGEYSDVLSAADLCSSGVFGLAEQVCRSRPNLDKAAS